MMPKHGSGGKTRSVIAQVGEESQGEVIPQVGEGSQGEGEYAVAATSECLSRVMRAANAARGRGGEGGAGGALFAINKSLQSSDAFFDVLFLHLFQDEESINLVRLANINLVLLVLVIVLLLLLLLLEISERRRRVIVFEAGLRSERSKDSHASLEREISRDANTLHVIGKGLLRKGTGTSWY